MPSPDPLFAKEFRIMSNRSPIDLAQELRKGLNEFADIRPKQIMDVVRSAPQVQETVVELPAKRAVVENGQPVGMEGGQPAQNTLELWINDAGTATQKTFYVS